MFVDEARTFIDDSIGESWLNCLKKIYNEGTDFIDEGRPMKELVSINFIISKPNSKDSIIEKLGSKETIKEFLDTFFGKRKWLKDVDIKPNFGDFDAISYSVRLFNFNGFNQVENIIQRLSLIPESKRCLISLSMPDKDWDKDYLPCIDTIHFLLRDKHLHAYVHCRGLDFAQKAYANLICLAKLQERVLNGINKKTRDGNLIGSLNLMIDSCHFYEDTRYIVEEILQKEEKHEKT